MPRPFKCRKVFIKPDIKFFLPEKPKDFDEINLTLDELEAIRLADLEGFYQEDAAKIMNISRQTFGNILNSAHRKVAESLVFGKVLKIEGGFVKLENSKFPLRCKRKRFCYRGGEVMNKKRMGNGGCCICPKCGYKKEHTPGIPCREEKCPECNIPLIREGSYHHQLIQKKKGGSDV